MTKKIIALLFALAGGAACYHGREVTTLTTPTEPNGAQITLDLTSGPFAGELLSVEQTGLLLLSGNRIVLVPFETIRHGRFPEFPSTVLLGVGKPSDTVLYKARLLSHFPGGVSPLIKEKLLTMYHQTGWASIQ